MPYVRFPPRAAILENAVSCWHQLEAVKVLFFAGGGGMDPV